MRDFYKPVDGDIVKVLPILKKDGTFCPFIKTEDRNKKLETIGI